MDGGMESETMEGGPKGICGNFFLRLPFGGCGLCVGSVGCPGNWLWEEVALGVARPCFGMMEGATASMRGLTQTPAAKPGRRAPREPTRDRLLNRGGKASSVPKGGKPPLCGVGELDLCGPSWERSLLPCRD